MELLSNYLFVLFLTIVIELFVALLFGFTKKYEILTVILVNIITNPVLNYLLLLNSYFSIIKSNFLFTLFLECIVVLLEWQLLVFVLEKDSKKMFLLSTVMNFCSCTLGIFIFWYI